MTDVPFIYFIRAVKYGLTQACTNYIFFLQVIIFYQLSPLLKVVDNQQVLAQMQMNFIKLLHSQVDKKIKLLK